MTSPSTRPPVGVKVATPVLSLLKNPSPETETEKAPGEMEITSKVGVEPTAARPSIETLDPNVFVTHSTLTGSSPPPRLPFVVVPLMVRVEEPGI